MHLHPQTPTPDPCCSVLGGHTNDDNAATLTGSPPYLPEDAFPPSARSFCERLMSVDPSQRLGCAAEGLTEVMRHPFFADHVDWVALEQRAGGEPGRWVPPPSLSQLDTSNKVLPGDDELEVSASYNFYPIMQSALLTLLVRRQVVEWIYPKTNLRSMMPFHLRHPMQLKLN